MHNIYELTEDNISAYRDYVGADVAENLGRTYYHGLIVCDDSAGPVAGIVWEFRKLDSEEDSESVIEWIRVEDETAFEEMMEAYNMQMADKEIRRSKVVIPTKDGKILNSLLKKVGFDMKLSESDLTVVRLSELSGSPFIKKLEGRKIPDSIKALKSINPRTFRAGIAKCVVRGRKGLCEDLGDLYINWFEDDVSCASLDEKGINGFFLFHKKPSGLITVQLMICLDSDFKIILPRMMHRFVKAMEEKYGPDQKVAFDRHNEQTMLLAERLIPRGFGTPVYSGSREENNGR